MKTLFLLPIVLLLSHAEHLLAGSVINSNLPAGTVIVNINAQEDGTASYGGGNTGQAFFYQPFGSGPNGLLSIPVSPGTYTFRIVDPADVAQEFPSLTAAQLSTLFTAWTYNSPWVTQYMVFDISATTAASKPQLFDGADNTSSYDNAQDAYNATVAAGGANLIQIDTMHGREGTNYTTTYSFTTATSLVFVIPDSGLSDNNGGVSVVVQKVPAPAFFNGETALTNGVDYLAFLNGNYFGYYSFLSDPRYLYHFDLGYEYVFDADDGKSGVYLYDFASSTFFYTSPTFPFPYLYDFSLNTVLYYYPDPSNAGHYNTNGTRFFYNFATGKIITK